MPEAKKPLHIHANRGDIAPLVLVVGDPARAELLSNLLNNKKIINKNRGLDVYTGEYNGRKVTIATHGIGAPSILITLEELAMLGAKTIIRIGSAGGIAPEATKGRILIATSSTYIPGTCGLSLYSNKLQPPTAADTKLTMALYNALLNYNPLLGPVFCSDSFYAESREILEEALRLGAKAVEMESAPLFALQNIRGFKSGAVLLIVNNALDPKDEFINSAVAREKFIKITKSILDLLLSNL